MSKFQFNLVIAVFVCLLLSQTIRGQNNFQTVVDGIDDIYKSIEDIDNIVKAFYDGQKFLTDNYPEARKDVVIMMNEMDKTLVGLSSACSIITHFSFIMDNEPSVQNLQRFNDQFSESRDLNFQLSKQLDILRGSCHKIREHANKIESETNVSGFFEILGFKPDQEILMLSESLQQIYDDESGSYLAISRLYRIIDLTLEDIRITLGGPLLDSANIPEAANLLMKYSTEFARLETNSNYIVMKIRSLNINLD